eukprot:10118628-Prorocentrum_lima.AAC.1
MEIWASDKRLFRDPRPLQCNGRHHYIPTSSKYLGIGIRLTCRIWLYEYRNDRYEQAYPVAGLPPADRNPK